MIDTRLEALRALMKEEEIDLYLVPTEDFHQSEYVGEYFKAREFITGFNGSAGTALISQDQALLFTDARYFLQAENQLASSEFKLVRLGSPSEPSLLESIEELLPEAGRLAFDGRLISVDLGLALEKNLDYKSVDIKYDIDLIDRIWENRPELSKQPAFLLPLKYAGEDTASKLRRIRAQMEKLSANSHLITSIDDICWILNIRGDDVNFSPLVLSYLMIHRDQVELYIDRSKLDQEIIDYLRANGVEVFHDYNQIYADLEKLRNRRLLIDRSRLNYRLYKNIDRSSKKIEARNPSVLFKAIKNPVEIENMRQAQLKDSLAHIKFIYWLKNNFRDQVITEISAIEKLDSLRASMSNFIRPSFEAISAFGPNAALVHYTASEESNSRLEEGNFFLTDTGAGFLEGSTDITRTYALGTVSQSMKRDFTLCLRAHLNLSSANFLYGVNGMNLDILARKPFWDEKLDYKHGTGHGIGYLLNIHEDPVGFRWQFRPSEADILEPGMILTNEPGIYRQGSHGVRLENEILVRQGLKNEYGQFMYFENLTFIPFDLDGLDPDLLSQEEKDLLNNYHRQVYEKTQAYLSEEERNWLRDYTRAI